MNPDLRFLFVARQMGDNSPFKNKSVIFLKPTIKTAKTFKFGQKRDMPRNMSDQVCRCCLHSVTHWTHSTRQRVRLPQGETIESKSHLHFSPFFLHICLRAACHIKFNTYLHAAFHILYGCSCILYICGIFCWPK